MSGHDEDDEGTLGHRGGRHTTAQERALGHDAPDPHGEMEPDATGVAVLPQDMDGFQQPTAMFDRGEFLGELAELVDGAPDTRAAVETEIPPPAGCRLIIVAGPDLGVEWAFKKSEITIGRGSDNDIDFSEIGVSRYHSRIALDGTSFVVTDLGSNNGTFLNGEKISSEALSSGDEIIVGSRTLRFVELNEAPPTAAAHPVADLDVEADDEPSSGRPSEIVEVAGRAEPDLDDDADDEGSRVDVPDVGSIGPISSPATPVATRPKRGSFAKSLAVGVAGLVLLAGMVFMGVRVYQQVIGESPEERALRAKTEFLQGIELVKRRRFADALVLFEDVLELRPEYTRAKEYAAHSKREIEAWKTLEAARALASEEKYPEALFELQKLPEGSSWANDASKLRERCQRALAKIKVGEARVLVDAGDLEGALDILREVLADVPGFSPARKLVEQIELLRNPPEPEVKPRRIKRPEVPELMKRSVGLYRSGQLSSAIDAAEAAGGPDAQRYMENMRRAKSLLKEVETAHRKKAAADILRLAPELLALDEKLSLEKRSAVRGMVREFYADALYLKGLEAQQDGNLGSAFKLMTEATKVMPGHKLSVTRLAELARKGREIYYEGYVLKDSDPDEAKKLFRRVVEVTPPENSFHKKAARWLKAH